MLTFHKYGTITLTSYSPWPISVCTTDCNDFICFISLEEHNFMNTKVVAFILHSAWNIAGLEVGDEVNNEAKNE